MLTHGQMHFQFPPMSCLTNLPLFSNQTLRHDADEYNKQTLRKLNHYFFSVGLSVSAPLGVFSMFTLQIQNMPTRECCVKEQKIQTTTLIMTKVYSGVIAQAS